MEWTEKYNYRTWRRRNWRHGGVCRGDVYARCAVCAGSDDAFGADGQQSVGGQVGIDYSGVKNIVGAFLQPALVLY